MNQSAREVVFGEFKFNYRAFLDSFESKLKELKQLTSSIDTSGQEPLIKGTAIEAHRIAALLAGGMTMDEVLRDYPSLTKQKVLAAKIFAQSHEGHAPGSRREDPNCCS